MRLILRGRVSLSSHLALVAIGARSVVESSPHASGPAIERSEHMGLSESRVTAIVAVSDLETARSFYEGKLGLSDYEEQPDGGRTYSCAEGTRIHVYPSPDNAGKSTATVAGFTVDDVEGTVDELTGNGITF